MSKASRKGREGENVLVKILNDIFKHWEYRWFRTPMQEKAKVSRFGDVNLIPKDGNENCVLSDVLFDAQKADTLTIVGKMKKLMDEKLTSGRSHVIYFGEETTGSGSPNLQLVAMDIHTFKYLIQYLQGYVSDESDEDTGGGLPD